MAKVLGIALFSALMYHPVALRAATVSSSYGAVLNWNGNPDPAVAGYRIFYGTNSGNYSFNLTAGNVTSSTVSGLKAGVTYFFAVATIGTNGLESPLSEEVRFVPGLMTLQWTAAPSLPAALMVSGLIGEQTMTSKPPKILKIGRLLAE